MKAKIVSADQAQQKAKGSRKSPAQLILESLDGDYKTYSEMATRYGVHIETLRRLCRSDKVKAPSDAVESGEMIIYLFNADDVKELDTYFELKGWSRKGATTQTS